MMKIACLLLLYFSLGIHAENLSQGYLRANNELASEVLKEVSKVHRDNVVFSGFSLESILALTSLGSKGATLAEIKKVLQLPGTEDEIKAIYSNLHNLLNQAEHIEISSANRVFLADNVEVQPNFIKTAEDVFKAGVDKINFGNTNEAAETINSWVSKETHDKIKNLVKSDQLSDITKLVLVNALYFKGQWEYPFKKHLTSKKDFRVSTTETIQVDEMTVTAGLPIYRSDEHNVTFIRLPYFGTKHRAVLTIVLPDNLEEPDSLQKYLQYSVPSQNYTRTYSRVFLPKFRIETSIDMKPVLKNLGVNDIFGRPDLSGITTESLKVDSVNQKVFINVDEYGTEAAAATSMIALARTLRIPVDYHVSRPFLFSLQYDDVSLLTGRVVRPSST